MNFSVLIPVGRREIEIGRLYDLADCLFHYEPQISEFVIVDDSWPARTFEGLAIPASCKLVILPNPRRGSGDGWLGGLVAALTTGCDWLERNSQCDFLVKVDTDTLVIAPFAEKV